MPSWQKLLVYLAGFLIGCVLVALLPIGERPPPRAHSWHAQTAPDGYYPFAFTDDLGRRHRLERQPRHLVSLAPSITAMLFAMGMGDHLVAVTRWCDWPDEARALRDAGAQIGDIDQPSRELLAKYRPDLVLGSDLTPASQYPLIEQAARAPAIALRHGSLEDIYDDIAALGRILGVPGHALALLGRLRTEEARIDALVEAHAAAVKPRVLLLLDIEADFLPGWSPGADTGPDTLIAKAHGANITRAFGQSWGQLSFEGLLAADPQVILLQDGGTPETRARLRATVARLPAHPLWGRLAAVQAGRIHYIDPGVLSVPGPRTVELYATIAQAIWREP